MAGTGVNGYGGDGGPASSATINAASVTSVTDCLYTWADARFASDGSNVLADTYNYRIRRIDGSGTITTIVGDGGD